MPRAPRRGARSSVSNAEVARALREMALFLVSARDPGRVGRAFATMPEVVNVHARGETRTLVRLASGMDADLRVIAEAGFGAALCHFTGRATPPSGGSSS